MQQNVNANRMNLMRLRKRLALATRGHSLLKQKLDELMHIFQKEEHKLTEIKKAIESQLKNTYEFFVLGSSLVRGDYLNVLISAPLIKVNLKKEQNRLLNLKIPHFSVDLQFERPPFSFLETNFEIDKSVRELTKALPFLVEYSEQQHKIELLLKEIETTRRRVNALEYILIPDFEQQIKFIQMKLDENERADINRLMRIKSIIRKEK